MKQEKLEVSIPVAEGVSVSYQNGVFSAKGKAGEISKKMFHPKITITPSQSEVVISANDATKREKMQIGTFKSHVRNLIGGASEGYTYTLKICSGHFPMTATMKGDVFELKNFLGESVPRKKTMKKGAKVEINGADITVTAADKELAGQVAADIEQITRITNKDRRIFQDGIYITTKNGKQM